LPADTGGAMPALCSDAAGWISSQTIVGDVEVPWWAARCRRLFSSPVYQLDCTQQAVIGGNAFGAW